MEARRNRAVREAIVLLAGLILDAVGVALLIRNRDEDANRTGRQHAANSDDAAVRARNQFVPPNQAPRTQE